MWTRGELKERGKAAFKANYWKCVLVALIVSLVSGGLSSGSGYKSGGNVSDVIEQIKDRNDSHESESDNDDFEDITSGIAEEIENDSDNGSESGAIAAVIIVAFVIFIIVIVAMVIGFVISAFLLNPVKVGCNRFFVRNLEEPAELSNLSRGFDGNYKNVVKILFFRDLYIFLWCLIPIAGVFIAIVKGLEYRMIPYLLTDDPDIDKDEAFALSREMMDGQKWNAFVLDLSFLGWHLLSLLTLGILEIFYVAPYVQSTNAALYETLNDGYTDNSIEDKNSGYIDGDYTGV